MILSIELFVNKADGTLYELIGEYAISQDGRRMRIDGEEFRKAMVRLNDPVGAYNFMREELIKKGLEEGN